MELQQISFPFGDEQPATPPPGETPAAAKEPPAEAPIEAAEPITPEPSVARVEPIAELFPLGPETPHQQAPSELFPPDPEAPSAAEHAPAVVEPDQTPIEPEQPPVVPEAVMPEQPPVAVEPTPEAVPPAPKKAEAPPKKEKAEAPPRLAPPKELFIWDPMPEATPPPPKPVRTPAAKGTRGRKSVKELAAAADLIDIPEDDVLFQKQYYAIGEVAAMFKVNTSLIRYWETEFNDIKPRKNKKGDRFFTPADIKTLELIHFLLRRKKLTIEGAKEYLRAKSQDSNTKLELVRSLEKIKAFLLELKARL